MAPSYMRTQGWLDTVAACSSSFSAVYAVLWLSGELPATFLFGSVLAKGYCFVATVLPTVPYVAAAEAAGAVFAASKQHKTVLASCTQHN